MDLEGVSVGAACWQVTRWKQDLGGHEQKAQVLKMPGFLEKIFSPGLGLVTLRAGTAIPSLTHSHFPARARPAFPWAERLPSLCN